MARTYELGTARRIVNTMTRSLARYGLAGKHTYMLTVVGRKTGQPHSTPVRLIENDERWLVAPYGEVGWVRNARAAGQVSLSRGRHQETMHVEEVDSEQAAPVLQEYLKAVAVVRPFFDVTTTSALADFVAEAPRHPVFRLRA